MLFTLSYFCSFSESETGSCSCRRAVVELQLKYIIQSYFQSFDNKMSNVYRYRCTDLLATVWKPNKIMHLNYNSTTTTTTHLGTSSSFTTSIAVSMLEQRTSILMPLVSLLQSYLITVMRHP